MTDGALAFNAMSGAGALLTGSSPQRGRDAYNGGTLYDFYETADGQFMALGAVEPNFFAAFADGIGHPEWASLGIAGGESLKVQVADLIRTRTRDEWVQAFAGIDACFDPVLSLTEALESPNSIAREMVADVPTASGTTMRQIGSPFKFSGTPVEFRFAGHPKDDSMHYDILSRLGYTREQVTEMEASGVFG
jgi:crotonobetainyl-CoA:carnitine CoA-transferase CaiB-like acyl-CoA transferase